MTTIALAAEKEPGRRQLQKVHTAFNSIFNQFVERGGPVLPLHTDLTDRDFARVIPLPRELRERLRTSHAIMTLSPIGGKTWRVSITPRDLYGERNAVGLIKNSYLKTVQYLAQHREEFSDER